MYARYRLIEPFVIQNKLLFDRATHCDLVLPQLSSRPGAVEVSEQVKVIV
jgi:hypothetical protein